MSGQDLWFPWVDPVGRHALARWSLPDDTVRWLGAMPADYHASRDGGVSSYANHMIICSLTRAGERLVRGWLSKNELFVYDLAGSVVDSFDIPVLRRRGVPDNLRYLYDVELVSVRERQTINSRLRQLHTLPDGAIAFIHHDQEILSMDGPLPVMAAHVWLGVVSPDLERACVDAPVPASLDARAAEAFRGDTLFVLDRRIVGTRLGGGGAVPEASERAAAGPDRPEGFGLSARGDHRVLRVAPTVADLAGEEAIGADAVAEAIHYRVPGGRGRPA